MPSRASVALPAFVVALAFPAGAAGAGDAAVAALQVALSARGLYPGPIDGVAGPETERAVRLAKLALNKGISGALEGPSAYLMKAPPRQIPDDEAYDAVERFIAQNRRVATRVKGTA